MGIHILGICGTFMGGVALLARQQGMVVSGSDENVYPPMSTMLEQQGVTITAGYQTENMPEADAGTDIVVGNVMRRGLDVVEHMLDSNLSYTSGPQWLYENILCERWVLAVAGTHGKTTTASMLAWILEYAGLQPGFLIGGVPENFGLSARLGKSPFFVIEADEYDTAFFDKQSKFMHYCPSCLIINNIEFDHADIYSSIEEIKKTFFAVANIVPPEGIIISCKPDALLQKLLSPVNWCAQKTFSVGGDYHAENISSAGREFDMECEKGVFAVKWNMIGEHY